LVVKRSFEMDIFRVLKRIGVVEKEEGTFILRHHIFAHFACDLGFAAKHYNGYWRHVDPRD
jgi:hypothetical protein